jgi:hypothetical protein
MTIKRLEAGAVAPGKSFELSSIPSDGTSEVLRLELEERIVSIPLREIVRWQSSSDGTLIVFQTLSDSVVVSGAGLSPIHTGADQGRLRLLRPLPRRSQGEVWVKTIELLSHERTQSPIG